MSECSFKKYDAATISVLIAGAVLLLGGSSCFRQPAKLTQLIAPDEFTVGNPKNLILLIFVEGENLDPTAIASVDFDVKSLDGEPLGARQTHAISISDVALRDATVGFDFSSVTYAGKIHICARSSAAEGVPCKVVELFQHDVPATLRDVAGLREMLRERFPGIGCRCTSGEIKISANESPDGSLGKFSNDAGGNVLGDYHAGNIHRDNSVTSTMKFEAHFTAQIINKPDQGNVADALWPAIQGVMLALCEEGQRINATTYFKAGTVEEIAVPEKTRIVGATVPVIYPYDPSSPPGGLQLDGHGYLAPGTSVVPEIDGRAKSWEQTDVIHWIDNPGLTDVPSSNLGGWEAMRDDAFFHAYVHGTTGDKADNCDCYFGIRSGVINANGDTEASSIISPVNCE